MHLLRHTRPAGAGKMIRTCLRLGEQSLLGRFVFFLRENSLLAEGEELLELGRFLGNGDGDSFFPRWFRWWRRVWFARWWWWRRSWKRMRLALQFALVGVVHQISQRH